MTLEAEPDSLQLPWFYFLLENNRNNNERVCPVCMIATNVRVSGKQNGYYQYYCKECHTYFIPNTINNPTKKIWHDRIRYKRLRRIELLAK